MKFLNFLRSLLIAAPRIEQKIEVVTESIVEIPEAVAEAIANDAVPTPKKKKPVKKK